MMMVAKKYARRERDPTTSPEMHFFISSRDPRHHTDISLSRMKIPRITRAGVKMYVYAPDEWHNFLVAFIWTMSSCPAI